MLNSDVFLSYGNHPPPACVPTAFASGTLWDGEALFPMVRGWLCGVAAQTNPHLPGPGLADAISNVFPAPGNQIAAAIPSASPPPVAPAALCNPETWPKPDSALPGPARFAPSADFTAFFPNEEAQETGSAPEDPASPWLEERKIPEYSEFPEWNLPEHVQSDASFAALTPPSPENTPVMSVSVPALAAEIIYQIDIAGEQIDLSFSSETLGGCSIHVAAAPAGQPAAAGGRGVCVEFSGPGGTIDLLQRHMPGLREHLMGHGVFLSELRLVTVPVVPNAAVSEHGNSNSSGQRRRRREE